MSTDTVIPKQNTYQTELDSWITQEKAAIELMGIVGRLRCDRSIELIIFHKPLHDVGVSEVLNHHEYSRNIVGKPITVFDSLEVARGLERLSLAPSRIDLGKLTFEWLGAKAGRDSVASFLTAQLKGFEANGSNPNPPKDVILYGFGRIGRLAARELIAQSGKGDQLRLRAIVTRSNTDHDLEKRADLLRTDSVHGPFPATIIVDVEKKALIINGHTVTMIAANNPDTIDYTAYGINDALVIDNTGVWRDKDTLGLHLKSKGVSKVMLTAPGKSVPNVVYGVNHNDFDPDKEDIWSAASCTTNAIVPVLKVIEDVFGIEKGHVETIHAYTNDQNLLDNYHKKYRRGRSAALNMVITETGAGKAVAKVIPHLAGKLTSNAVRVPTPDGSLAILNLTLKKNVTLESVKAALKDAALNGELVEQIHYSFSNELVSSDIVGNYCAAIFDSPATIVSEDGRSVVLYVWYDNEYGYTRQVLRLSKYIAKVRRMVYY
ncbi:MAG: glyceraldehyde-3-phosphate dehydrogenase [Flavobacteriales bacterium]|nr:glyceraldehyde-3-phosphate dehydrogenase [Flavobacteriales bacterium]